MKQLLLIALLASPALASGGYTSGNATIAQIVQNDPNFSTLLAAVQAAGLVETLNSPGPYTVFAPTNAAFAALPPGQLQALLNDRNALRNVLLYHVVPGRVTSAQVVGLRSANTASGGTLRISTMNGQVMINDSRVIAADVRASNGVIHVINRVMLP